MLEIITIVTSLAAAVGMWKVFVKFGKKGWLALIPLVNGYKLGECVRREKDGFFMILLTIVIRGLTVLSAFFDPESLQSDILSISQVVLMIPMWVLSVRIYMGLAEAFGRRKRWAVLFFFFDWIGFLLFGFSKKFMPLEDYISGDHSGADVSNVSILGDGSGLSVNLSKRTAVNFFKKVTLLRDIHLTIPTGHMVLLLGGSGAGKTTFLNAVTGYEKADAKITEGGIDYYQQFDQVKHRIGFVPQENLLREEDTVLMTVRNAADLRLPKNMPEAEKEQRIHLVLETFGLSGHEGSLVSKLSGGQKKRLSICTEFIASPSLFILDEPDSGLDGIMAMELMENLRLIASQGKIVMVITHAPDRVAHLFDKVIVLARGTENHIGQLAFYGSIPEAKRFFGVSTLEQVVKQINAPSEGGKGLADQFITKFETYARQRDARHKAAFREAGEEPAQTEESFLPNNAYKGRLQQIPIFLGKYMRLFITEGNWKVLPLAAIIAFLVVYVIGKNMFVNMEGTAYAAFAITCVCLWNGIFNSIQVVCKEREIIKREHRAGLHISSYLASHAIYQAMICLIQVLMSVAIFVVAGVHMPSFSAITGSFLLDLIITMFLITYSSDALGLMISCIVHTPMAAMTVMPFVLIVQLVFANFVLPLDDTGKLLSNGTISKWGIQAVCSISDYNHQESIAILSALNMMSDEDPEGTVSRMKRVLSIDEVKQKVGEVTAAHLQNPGYDSSTHNVLKNWLILLGFIALYGLIGLIFLENVDRDKR